MCKIFVNQRNFWTNILAPLKIEFVVLSGQLVSLSLPFPKTYVVHTVEGGEWLLMLRSCSNLFQIS